MTFEYLKNQNLIISRTKRAFEVKQKTFFLVSKMLSFRYTKQSSKNVADTTFKWIMKIIIFVLWGQISLKISNFHLILSFSNEKIKKIQCLLCPIALSMASKTKCRRLMGGGGRASQFTFTNDTQNHLTLKRIRVSTLHKHHYNGH